MSLREAAQQALEALEFMADEWGFTQKANRPERWQAIDALRAALEQPYAEQSRRVEQETHGRMRIDPVTGNVSIGTPTEQPVQEQVAWRWRLRSPTDAPGFAQPWNVTTYYPREQANEIEPLYTHPPRRREWRGLTEEEINEATFHPDGCMNTHIEFARAIEAALRSKNHE